MSLEQHLTEALERHHIFCESATPKVLDVLRGLAHDGVLVIDFRTNPQGQPARLTQLPRMAWNHDYGSHLVHAMSSNVQPEGDPVFVLEHTEDTVNQNTEYAFVLFDHELNTRGVFLTWDALIAAMPDYGWPHSNPAGVGVIKGEWHAERVYVNPAHLDGSGVER